MKTAVMLFILVAVLSCNDQQHQSRPISEAELKERLLDYNKAKVNEEDDLIDAFLQEHQLDFQKTDTGLRYRLDNDQSGTPLKPGDQVAVKYTIHLLDSTLCYDNFDRDPMWFTVNGSDVASGFHELALLTGRGAKARSIWPARLGYGLAGDLDRIPQDAILLVDLEVK